ncbi:hypothetical protein D3C72_1951520 [compost metagenome]
MPVLLRLVAKGVDKTLAHGPEICRQGLEPLRGNQAKAGGFQRHGAGLVLRARQAVQADDLAGQMEAEDLAAAAFRADGGLDRANAHGIEFGRGVAGPVQGVALEQPYAPPDQRNQSCDFRLAHA